MGLFVYLKVFKYRAKRGQEEITMRKRLLPLNLQLFAEEGQLNNNDNQNQNNNDDEANAGETGADDNANNGFEPVTTQSQLDSLINKAVHAALDNQKKKNESQVEEAVRAALEKEKSYAEMSEEERKEAEITEREKKLAEREAELNYKDLLADVKTDLSTKELPVQFAEMLAVAGDKEKSLSNVTEFEKAFKAEVAEQVKRALRQSDPGTGTGGTAQVNHGAQLAKKTHASTANKPFN